MIWPWLSIMGKRWVRVCSMVSKASLTSCDWCTVWILKLVKSSTGVVAKSTFCPIARHTSVWVKIPMRSTYAAMVDFSTPCAMSLSRSASVIRACDLTKICLMSNWFIAIVASYSVAVSSTKCGGLICCPKLAIGWYSSFWLSLWARRAWWWLRRAATSANKAFFKVGFCSVIALSTCPSIRYIRLCCWVIKLNTPFCLTLVSNQSPAFKVEINASPCNWWTKPLRIIKKSPCHPVGMGCKLSK